MKNMSSKMMVVLSILATILILIANLGLWLQRDVFDKRQFVQKTVTILQQKPVREAIASEMVDTAFSDVPAVKALVEDFLESSLSALLDSEIIEPAVGELAGQIYDVLTSEEPKAVAIDIKSVTDPIKSAVPEIPGIDPKIKTTVAELPDSIVLIEKGEIPSFYSVGVFFLWVGPIAGLVAFALFIAVLWGSGAARRTAGLKIVGLTLSLGAAIFLFLVRAFQVPILASVDGNIRVVLDRIYFSFTAGLFSQTRGILVIGLLTLAAGFAIDLLRPRFEKPLVEQESKKAA